MHRVRDLSARVRGGVCGLTFVMSSFPPLATHRTAHIVDLHSNGGMAMLVVMRFVLVELVYVFYSRHCLSGCVQKRGDRDRLYIEGAERTLRST